MIVFWCSWQVEKKTAIFSFLFFEGFITNHAFDVMWTFYNLVLLPFLKSPHAKQGIKRRHSQDDSHHKKEEEKLAKKRHTSGPTKEPVSGPAKEPSSGPAIEPVSGPAIETVSGPAIEPVSGPAPTENQIPANNTGMCS